MVAIACSFSPVFAQEQAKLSLAFLEYLAEMEQVDGDWIDATDIKTPNPAEPEAKAQENQSNTPEPSKNESLQKPKSDKSQQPMLDKEQEKGEGK